MSALNKILIVGGGIAGMSAAIQLRKAGLAVDLVEKDPDWRVYGAGISITGPTLRAFKALGVLDEVMARGAVSEGARMLSMTGHLVADLPQTEFEPGVPANLGIMRPVLHGILSERLKASGAKVALGVSVDNLEDRGQTVGVARSDGIVGDYDLVIGADGLFSQVRGMAFPDAPSPAFTGQGCWRLTCERPADVRGVVMYLGGPVTLGFNPVSTDEMYLFVLEAVPGNPRIGQDELAPRLRGLLHGFDGRIDALRETISESSPIVYRPLEALLLPPPWHRGRIVLIGDAAHGTTPQLASGAGLAVEDAIVLAEELARDVAPAQALDAFAARRFERARVVVESSVRLGEIECAHGDPKEHRAVFERAAAALAAPI